MVRVPVVVTREMKQKLCLILLDLFLASWSYGDFEPVRKILAENQAVCAQVEITGHVLEQNAGSVIVLEPVHVIDTQLCGVFTVMTCSPCRNANMMWVFVAGRYYRRCETNQKSGGGK